MLRSQLQLRKADRSEHCLVAILPIITVSDLAAAPGSGRTARQLPVPQALCCGREIAVPPGNRCTRWLLRLIRPTPTSKSSSRSV